jgi:hypothetical protein
LDISTSGHESGAAQGNKDLMATITSNHRQPRQPRLVLCPNGVPVRHRAVCTSMLLHCGGDVNRMIDGPMGEEAFLRHLQRLTFMLDAVRPPIVLLTNLAPLMSRVVLLRERYEAELPALRQAHWLLFMDDDAGPFVGDALRQGRFDRHGSAAIWTGPGRKRYLALSPECDEPAQLEAAMSALTQPVIEYANDPALAVATIPAARRVSQPAYASPTMPAVRRVSQSAFTSPTMPSIRRVSQPAFSLKDGLSALSLSPGYT